MDEDADLAVSSAQLLAGAASRLMRALGGNGASWAGALARATDRALETAQVVSGHVGGRTVGAELQVVVDLLEASRREAELQASSDLVAITLELEAAQRCLHASTAGTEGGAHGVCGAASRSLAALADATDLVLSEIAPVLDAGATENGIPTGGARVLEAEPRVLEEELRAVRRDLLLVQKALCGTASVRRRVDLNGTNVCGSSHGNNNQSQRSPVWTLPRRGSRTGGFQDNGATWTGSPLWSEAGRWVAGNAGAGVGNVPWRKAGGGVYNKTFEWGGDYPVFGLSSSGNAAGNSNVRGQQPSLWADRERKSANFQKSRDFSNHHLEDSLGGGSDALASPPVTAAEVGVYFLFLKRQIDLGILPKPLFFCDIHCGCTAAQGFMHTPPQGMSFMQTPPQGMSCRPKVRTAPNKARHA